MTRSRRLHRWVYGWLIRRALRRRRSGAITRAAETRLIRAEMPTLFDATYYARQDGAPDSALRDYVRRGSRAGRNPHPLVDEAAYRGRAGLDPDAPITALTHWFVIGRARGLSPLKGFDPEAYRRTHPEVVVAKLVPEFHAALRGSWPPQGETGPAPVPSLSALCALPAPRTGSALVDVVVPVHGGMDETLTCLRSLLAAPTETAFEIVVVDDATPEPALAEALDTLAAAGCITLLRHEANRGFAAAVNRGSAMHPDRDVVWLNADTEVYPGWLDRLRAAALAEPDIATATPFTTNGTVCSYPRFDRDNPDPLELPWADLDALAARVNAGIRIDLPTAVAFATYVRRDALEVIGPLDAETFGRGYGEETDFCRRGRVQGWRDVLAADVFVHHRGATSFGPEKAERLRAANAAINHRYSGYHAEVQRFKSQDPAAGARFALDRARLLRQRRGQNILYVTHQLGGGVHRAAIEDMEQSAAAGAQTFVMTGVPRQPNRAIVYHPKIGPLPSLECLPFDDDPQALLALLRAIGPDEIRLHHLIDFGRGAADRMARLVDALAVPLTVILHDHYAICPRVNLTDRQGVYCGEPGPTGCRLCLAARGSRVGRTDIVAWRHAHGAFLAKAAAIHVSSVDARDRLLRHFPFLQTVALTELEEIVPAPPRRLARPRATPLRIGVIGSIGVLKGYRTLLACADHARRRNLALCFVVMGYTMDDDRARRAGIVIDGPYGDTEAAKRLQRLHLDGLFYPAAWPETWSYTLSIGLTSGLPIVAFDIGAIAERLRSAGRGYLLPIEARRHPATILAALHDAVHAHA